MNFALQQILGFVFTLLLFSSYFLFGFILWQRFGRVLYSRVSPLAKILVCFFTGLFFQTWISFLFARPDDLRRFFSANSYHSRLTLKQPCGNG